MGKKLQKKQCLKVGFLDLEKYIFEKCDVRCWARFAKSAMQMSPINGRPPGGRDESWKKFVIYLLNVNYNLINLKKCISFKL